MTIACSGLLFTFKMACTLETSICELLPTSLMLDTSKDVLSQYEFFSSSSQSATSHPQQEANETNVEEFFS